MVSFRGVLFMFISKGSVHTQSKFIRIRRGWRGAAIAIYIYIYSICTIIYYRLNSLVDVATMQNTMLFYQYIYQYEIDQYPIR